MPWKYLNTQNEYKNWKSAYAGISLARSLAQKGKVAGVIKSGGGWKLRDLAREVKTKYGKEIPVELIKPDPNQPRKIFDPEKLKTSSRYLQNSRNHTAY